MKPSEGTGAHAPKPELAYAPARPWRRRRRTIRRAVLVALLLGTAGCLWWWHKPLLAHGQLLYWQHKCQTHTFAPDAVVASSSGPGGTTAAPIPAYWTSYEAAANPAVLLVGGPAASNPAFEQAIVFLHRLRSPVGDERVVAVRCVTLYLTSASLIQAFQPFAVEPAAAWPLTSRPTLHRGKFSGGYPIDAVVRVFGGQPDPADPAHFTIAYTVNDRPGIIDGRLRDDGTVDLRVREGSADVYAATKVPAAQ